MENEQVAVPNTTPNQPTTSSRLVLNYFVVAVTFLIVGLAMGLLMSQAVITRDQVEAVVRDVLADSTVRVNPDEVVDVQELSDILATTKLSIDDEAIVSALSANASTTTGGTTGTTTVTIDAEAIQQVVTEALAQNEAKKAEASRIKIVDDDPSIGASDAPITIVEFSAYACPYCARHFQTTFQPLLDTYGQYINYVYRDYPVINPDLSFSASLATQCANAQGKFWEFHNTLFNNQDKMAAGRDYFISVATDEQLDVALFTTCFDNQEYSDEVTADYYAGEELNVTGTPTFWINGTMISGAQPYERFERIILQLLQEAGVDVEQSS